MLYCVIQCIMLYHAIVCCFVCTTLCIVLYCGYHTWYCGVLQLCHVYCVCCAYTMHCIVLYCGYHTWYCGVLQLCRNVPLTAMFCVYCAVHTVLPCIPMLGSLVCKMLHCVKLLVYILCCTYLVLP